MKKSGKALSLVLSLALVVSSLATTFASAATAQDPQVGASVSLNSTNAIALVAGSTGGSAVILPTPTITYTASNGKQYVNTSAAYSWSSSNTSVATVSGSLATSAVTPGSTAGTATLTCTYSGQKLAYNGSPTDTVTVSGSASISVTSYASGSYLITDAPTPGDGIVPSTTTELAVNAAPAYSLYTVDSATNAYEAKFTKDANTVTWNSASSSYIAINPATGTIKAQDPTAVHIASTQITAKDGTTNKTASVVIHTAQIYDATSTGTATIAPSTTYGSGNAITSDNYNVTGYAIKGKTVNISGGSVASVTITAASGAASISGGTVTGAVTAENTGDTVSLTGGSVGSISAAGEVDVTPASTTTAKVGAISSNDKVNVTGSTATVGNVRAEKDIAVTNATTGSLTGVLFTASASTTADNTFPDVTVTSAKVNGSIVGNTVTVDGISRDTNNNVIPAVVSGNIVLMKNGLPTDTTATGAASALIGSGTDSQNVTVSGSIVDNDGYANISLSQGKNGTTKVGAVVGKTPAKTTDPFTTDLTTTGLTGTFASLPNFNVVTIDTGSDVTVTSAITAGELIVNGNVTLTGATLNGVSNVALSGSGKITMPAGSLVAKSAISGSLTLVPTSTVSTGTVVFKGIANQAGNITVPGVTLQQNDNGDFTYNYVAKTVAFAGIKLDKSTVRVAKNYSTTLTASAVPVGQALPSGDTIKWSVPDGSYLTVTPSADTMTATVYANSYSDVDLGGANEVTVSAYVIDKNGNQLYDYPVQTCAVTIIPVPDTAVFTSDTNGNVNMKTGATYQFKITSSDGSVPSFAVASNGATVAPYTKSGNAYFFKVTAAKAGTFGVYVGGAKVAQLVVTAPVVTIDTKAVTVKAGKTYQFKVTASAAPTFAVAGVGAVKASSSKGNDYFFKVTATNKAGSYGVYVNGARVAVITFA